MPLIKAALQPSIWLAQWLWSFKHVLSILCTFKCHSLRQNPFLNVSCYSLKARQQSPTESVSLLPEISRKSRKDWMHETNGIFLKCFSIDNCSRARLWEFLRQCRSTYTLKMCVINDCTTSKDLEEANFSREYRNQNQFFSIAHALISAKKRIGRSSVNKGR